MDPPDTEKKLPTFAEYAIDHMEVVKKALEATTYDAYHSNLKIHLLPVFGKVPLDQISRASVKAFLIKKANATWKRGKAGAKPYSQSAIGMMVATLRVILGEAVKDELIVNRIDWRGLNKLYAKATRKKKGDPFTQGEVDHLLDYMRREYPGNMGVHHAPSPYRHANR